MLGTIKFILLIVLGVFLTVGVLTFPVWAFHSKEITSFEIRFYIMIFLAYVAILVFGVLRLYNAIVGNTKTLIGVSRRLDKYVGSLRKITGDSTLVARSFTNAVRALDNLVGKIVEVAQKKPDKSDFS